MKVVVALAGDPVEGATIATHLHLIVFYQAMALKLLPSEPAF